jgi:hypothetical protein
MPVLMRRAGGAAVPSPFEIAWKQGAVSNAPSSLPLEGYETPSRGAERGGLFESCANPRCASGWLHLLRSRSAPVFEGGWSCSAACTSACIGAAVRRELEGRGSAQESHRHRIPLGLIDHLRPTAPGAGRAEGGGRRAAGTVAGAAAGCE